MKYRIKKLENIYLLLLFVILLVVDLVIPDPLPVIDELLLTILVYLTLPKGGK